ncbi:MAG: hypothetical protein RI955_1323 [Bacteroidota bacterium]
MKVALHKGKFCIIGLLLFYTHIAHAQIQRITNDDFIINVLKPQPDWFQQILYNQQEYQVQIIYTQINRDSTNKAHFTTYGFQADEFYFYPASWMKLPLAVFALEKLNEIKVDKNNILKIEPLFGNHNNEYNDVKLFQPQSIGQMIKEALVVSNNAAFNPLYDFVTQQRANKRLNEIGLKKAVFCNRFSISDKSEHRHSNFLEIRNKTNEQSILYSQIQTYNPVQPFCSFKNTEFGEQHFEKGKLVDGPKNFYYNNYIPLSEMNEFMKRFFFPKETFTTWNLTKEDFVFIKRNMAMLPRLNNKPSYDEEQYADAYMKYFLIGASKDRLPANIRIFDKLGQYFGWTSDAAYIVDYSAGVEFFISAVIYTNSKHIVADNDEEYKNIAAPFMAQLGKAFYEYELKRKRIITPHIDYIGYTNLEEEPKPKLSDKLKKETTKVGGKKTTKKTTANHHKKKTTKKVVSKSNNQKLSTTTNQKK